MSDFLLSLQDVSLAFGGPPVLDKVSLSISKGLRAALTGRNGEGKSTLMKVIAGAIEPDGGTIVRAPNLRTIYVSQDVPHDRPDDLSLEEADFILGWSHGGWNLAKVTARGSGEAVESIVGKTAPGGFAVRVR